MTTSSARVTFFYTQQTACVSLFSRNGTFLFQANFTLDRVEYEYSSIEIYRTGDWVGDCAASRECDQGLIGGRGCRGCSSVKSTDLTAGGRVHAIDSPGVSGCYSGSNGGFATSAYCWELNGACSWVRASMRNLGPPGPVLDVGLGRPRARFLFAADGIWDYLDSSPRFGYQTSASGARFRTEVTLERTEPSTRGKRLFLRAAPYDMPGNAFLTQASEPGAPLRGILGDYQTNARTANGSLAEAFVAPGAAIGGYLKSGGSCAFASSGVSMIPREDALPSRLDSADWSVTASGELRASLYTDFRVTLSVDLPPITSVSTLADVACPSELSVSEATGCYACDAGFGFNVTVSSDCATAFCELRSPDTVFLSDRSILVTVERSTTAITGRFPRSALDFELEVVCGGGTRRAAVWGVLAAPPLRDVPNQTVTNATTLDSEQSSPAAWAVSLSSFLGGLRMGFRGGFSSLVSALTVLALVALAVVFVRALVKHKKE